MIPTNNILFTGTDNNRAITLSPVANQSGLSTITVRVSDGALVQEGYVDAPDCDYLMPSLAVDSKGNIGLGCTRTSEKEFPSVYVMMHAATDTAGTMRAPVIAVKGTTHYRGPASGNTGAMRSNAANRFKSESSAPKITDGRNIVYASASPAPVASSRSALPLVRR